MGLEVHLERARWSRRQVQWIPGCGLIGEPERLDRSHRPRSRPSADAEKAIGSRSSTTVPGAPFNRDRSTWSLGNTSALKSCRYRSRRSRIAVGADQPVEDQTVSTSAWLKALAFS